MRKAALAAGLLGAVCALDLSTQAGAPYAPSPVSDEERAWADAYLAENLTALPDGWRWLRRAVPGGHVRTGEAGEGGAPTVLFVPGFTGTAEQYADYYAAWARRGWRIVSLDLPGQGGSMRRVGNPELPWSDDFGAYADAIAPVLAEEAARGPLVVVGESFGGHVVLRALAEAETHLADTAVLVVPALDAETGDVPRGLALGVAHAVKALGFGGSYAAGTGPWVPGAGIGDTLGRDETGKCGDRADRLGNQAALYIRQPDLRVSGPSWGWLAGLQSSGAQLTTPRAMARVTLPVLMVQSGQDQVVRNGRAAAACDAMADCERVVWDDTSHCLGVEEQEIQDRLHAVIEEAVTRAVAMRGAAALAAR